MSNLGGNFGCASDDGDGEEDDPRKDGLMLKEEDVERNETCNEDIVHTSNDEECVQPDPAESVRAKDRKKRTLVWIPFSLGKGLELRVGIYNLVREQKKPYPIKQHRQTSEPLKGKSELLSSECLGPTMGIKVDSSQKLEHHSQWNPGELLMPSDIQKYQMCGGRKVIFEKDEIDQMKKFGDPGLTLMGFKPRSTLKKYFHVQPAQFLFPDESSISGSGALFNALLQRSAARDVVAICRYIARKNTPPKFVALLPQKEELDKHKAQVSPPGFHIIFLPFADDMRKLDHPQAPKATADQIDKAKAVVKKLQFLFSPEDFQNPVLQTHFRNLEALALDRDAPEEITDDTAPDNEWIEESAGSLIRDIRDAVFPKDYDPTAKPAARKKVGGGTVDVEQQARDGKLSKLTVPVLKEFCQKYKLSTAGKKSDLISTIEGYLGL